MTTTISSFTPGAMTSGLPDDAEAVLDGLFPTRRIRRVLLVTPPDADVSVFRYATARRGRYTNYVPYGLAVIAQHLQAVGITVRMVNLNHAILAQCHEVGEADFDFDRIWQERLDDELNHFEPDLIGVTCMFTMTHTSLKKVCQRVKRAGVPVAIGGVHVSNDVDRVLDDIPDADIAFLREGEIAFRNFVLAVNRETPATELGQCIIQARGARHRFLRECVPDGEDLNVVPAYELTDIADLSRVGTIGAFYCFKPQGTRFATVLSNRGCRAQCTFCSVRNFNGVGVRQRSISSVVDELELLRDRWGVGHVMWLDDDLLMDHKRAVALFNEMVRRKVDLTWDATNGLIAASCTDEVIGAMAASGCIAVNIGMESGNPRILREVKKPGTVKTFLRAAEVLRKYEQIHSSLLLMIGFPGETFDEIQDTIDVAREMDLDWCRISPLQPLPNTPIYDSMVAQGLIADVGSSELRFMGGSYGKQAEIEQGLRMTTTDFRKVFNRPGNVTPSGDEITDIWFYMNYHLNFHRLFHETRRVKVDQQFAHLQTLCDVIAPENGFALYFIGYLQYQIHGRIDPAILQRLRQRLDTSSYWSDRFQAFRLSHDDLVAGNFANKDLPRLAPGRAIQLSVDTHDPSVELH
jgi:radical SAM superfamily enzyme YgiQ (UPF0313 family)